MTSSSKVAGTVHRLFIASLPFLACVISMSAESAVFNCGSQVSLDTAHPGEQTFVVEEHYEVRCRSTSTEFGCIFQERLPSGSLHVLSGGKVDAAARGFRLPLITYNGDRRSETSFTCTNQEANTTYDGSLKNYQCNTKDYSTGTTLATFPLLGSGVVSPFIVNGSSAHCLAGLTNIACEEGNGVSEAGYSYHSSNTFFGAQFFSQIKELRSTTVEIECLATDNMTMNPAPALPSVGIWEEAPTIGLPPAFPFEGFDILSNGSQPEVLLNGEHGRTSLRFDEDLSAWGDIGLTFPIPAPISEHTACNSLPFFTEPTPSGVYGVAAGCIYWRSSESMTAQYVGDIHSLFTLPTHYEFGQAAVGEKLFIWGGVSSMYSQGINSETNIGYIYDHVLNSWESIPTLGAPTPRRNPIVIAINSDEVFVWGGIHSLGDGNYTLLQDGAIFNLLDHSWRPIASANAHPGVALQRNVINFFSGNQVHAFWTGEEVLIWGGWNDERGYLSEGHLYNPATNTWRRMADGPPSFLAQAISMMTSQGFFLWDGYTRGSDPSTNINRSTIGWLYDSRSNSWKATPPEPSLRGFLFFTNGKSLGDKILFIGGSLLDTGTPAVGRYLRLVP